MAEGVLRRLLAGSGVDVDSAGTHDFGEGLAPHRLAVAAARRQGYDISGLTGRQVRAHDFHYFDMIVAMDRSNIAALHDACPAGLESKIVRLLDFNRMSIGRDVRDPVDGGPREFEACLRRIETGCAGLARYVVGQGTLARPDFGLMAA